MIPVIVIRPQPGCDATVAAGSAMGLDARAYPLFEIRPVPWEPPSGEFDALLLGSANAPRHAGPALERFRRVPAYCVGAATAEAARAAGLEVAATGVGGIKGLLPMLRPEHRRLLRLSGRDRMMLTPPRGVSLQERVVYASEPLPMPPGLETLLRQPALVLLHSAEAAHRFAGLCDAYHLARADLGIAAMGPRVARAAGEGWSELRCAATPSDTALLALAREMCQERRG